MLEVVAFGSIVASAALLGQAARPAAREDAATAVPAPSAGVSS